MKLLVAYDGSPEAKAAIKLAQHQAKTFGATIEVIKTITRDSPLKHAFIQEIEAELNREVEAVMAGGEVAFSTQLLVDSSTAGEQIVKFAENEGMDQLFIGIEKRSKVEKFVFGSTAQYVILQAPCPVVTVKTPHAGKPRGHGHGGHGPGDS
jgi:nucleotide-binding universal stress UspA family protein